MKKEVVVYNLRLNLLFTYMSTTAAIRHWKKKPDAGTWIFIGEL